MSRPAPPRLHVVCADRGIPLDGTKGASVHLRALVAALAAAAAEVTAFTARGGRPPEGVRLHPLSALAGAPRPDAVYERYSLGHLGGLAAARDWGVPFLLEVDAPLVAEARRHRPGTVGAGDAEAEAELFRGADVVVCVSEVLRRTVAAVRGTDSGTTVVSNGVDPAHHPRPAPLDGRAGQVIAFLGHPKPWHGASALVPVLHTLVAGGREARLLLIGGGPGADEVTSAASAAGLADRLEVTGPLPPDRAAARLAECLMSLAPYPPQPDFYFCPLKVLDSMAAGVPVVATSQGDIPALLGGTGMLVPPSDAEALAAAAGHLLTHPAARQDLGRRARARALSCFSWDGVARRILELAGTADVEVQAAR